MATNKTIATTVLRWASWPIIVVIALNIENRATEAGYSRVALRDLFGSDLVTELYDAATSDMVWGGALFLAGTITFNWLYYWLEKSEGKRGWWARTNLAANCEAIAKALEGPGLNRLFASPKRNIPTLNRQLAAFGFEPIPEFSENEERNKRSARYLRAIEGPIKSGDIEHAREIGEAVLNLEKAKAISRRSPLRSG